MGKEGSSEPMFQLEKKQPTEYKQKQPPRFVWHQNSQGRNKILIAGYWSTVDLNRQILIRILICLKKSRSHHTTEECSIVTRLVNYSQIIHFLNNDELNVKWFLFFFSYFFLLLCETKTSDPDNFKLFSNYTWIISYSRIFNSTEPNSNNSFITVEWIVKMHCAFDVR